jgi:hypothetical protein
VFHEKLLEGTKVKSLTPGSGVELSSTGELVTISVSPNLAVSTLTAPTSTPLSVVGGLQVSGLSQLAGIEASGLVAQQVVWVTGSTGAPNSIMFPGSLTLGKWRIRGTEAARFVLERFDDDGQVQTDAWLPVTAFTHDPDTNAAGLESAAVRVDTISPLDANAVTCNGHLTADNLTVGGVSFASLNFTAIEPLRKVVNLQTGAIELRVDTADLGGNPFFCAGRVNAAATVASSIGQVGYTVSRPGGFPTGVYRIQFDSPAPNNDYVISLAQLGSGNIKIWESTAPTINNFHVVTSNTTFNLTNWAFHFSVLT